MTVNSAMAATAIRDPTIGAAMKEAPFKITIATPAGKTIAPMNMQPALHLCQRAVSGRWNQPIIEPEQEQQNAADQIEMRVRRCQRKILLNTHYDPREHTHQ
jgi:hypothetical protein